MADTYQPALLPDSDDEFEEWPSGYPVENLASAAIFVRNILNEAGIPNAIIGGFGANIRGSERGTLDVDIEVEVPGRSHKTLLDLFRPHQRISLPTLPSDVLRILVKTGTPYDNCTTVMNVGVDLKHVAANTTLSGKRMNMSYLGEQFTILLPVYAFNGKLQAFNSRNADTDSEDIQFFLTRYRNELKSRADELDYAMFEYWLDEKASSDLKERWLAFLGLSYEASGN